LNTLETKVIEVTLSLVKYRNFSFQTEPLRSIEEYEVLEIKHENSSSEEFEVRKPEVQFLSPFPS